MRLLRYVFILIGFLSTSCMVTRTTWYNFTDITNYKIFPSRPLPASSVPFRFTEAQREPGQILGRISLQKIDSIANLDKSVAILIIRNDSLLFEKYYHDYSVASTVASFSIAKSYTSALIGVAMADGYIKSINDKLVTYVPELSRSRGFEKITLRHLLTMTSGIRPSESRLKSWGLDAKLYYGRHLYNYLMQLKVEGEPGKKFAYTSVNTQLLGLVLERVTGKTVTEYLNERIWRSLGTEYDASWSIDKKKDGHEKTFCCINAAARDFAKFGRLFLHRGNWNGVQLVPADWVDESTSSCDSEPVPYYKYHWWISENGYYASGLHGEYIYVNPAKGLIMIRLGKAETRSWPRIFDQISTLM